ncbi:mandelate racemase/muconate lactonizing enzyme family protein [Roseovarius sp. A21]|uniref:Mandelate racemase/muconate lactonizing enzyme family protein n=1 Tax=Roseovarius bejariae TaxID=2576383 RepID=A0A844CNE0_9RHOB|nr:mandelate racemase/muconate lactonizing enzyme family protein [Roseovarius bejariae]MRU16327.1 mandelate racemase/muconate lactonizing enzyme family protein [Roseovarius bejariae]
MIEHIQIRVFRAPTPRPVATSFGIMRDRPAVFVRLTANDGAFGWGEVFANWPAAGAEHRANLLIQDIAPLVLGQPSDDPAGLWHRLTRQTHIRALQCGEWGPFAQVLAGLDTACHDLAARRAGLPLTQSLNPDAAKSVPVYASGIKITEAEVEVDKARTQGITAFKLKIGFDMETDLAALKTVKADLKDNERLFTDANQAWDAATARHFMEAAQDLGLGWLEEPIAADAPKTDWASLAVLKAPPLAGGENITGTDGFETAIANGHLSYIQPDVAKWGGVTGCFDAAQKITQAGRTYCPHFLGGGVGLLASAHLLAAAGGDGLLELDINANPLRDNLLPEGTLHRGTFHLPDAPGLGVETLPDSLSKFETLTLEAKA